MATRASTPSTLSFTEISRLAAGVGPGKVLPPLLLLSSGGEEEGESRVLTHLLRCRHGGFMVVAPASEEVQTLLDSLGGEAAGLAVYKKVEIGLEDSRGRKFGQGAALLVDLAGEACIYFVRGPAMRGAGFADVVRLKVGDAVARPNFRSAASLADEWIADVGAQDDSLAEYLTAPEGEGGFPDEASDDQAETVARLQARIMELESQMASPVADHAARPGPGARFEPTRPQVMPTQLFAPVGGGGLDPGTMTRLKAMAGPAPSQRLQATAKTRARQPATAAQNAVVEHEAEVVEEDEVQQLVDGSSDPLHRILALQLQQTNSMMQRLASRHPPDPITGALGSDHGGSGTSGVKGCIARDAYVRAMEDVCGTGRIIMNNAAADLGLGDGMITSGLMKQYVEKRIPLADHKLLTYMAQFMACSWQIAFESRNEEAMGLFSRGIMMIEQISLDHGRCQFGWLLSGMVEPNMMQISMNRQRLGLKPYSKLAAAPWIAGNVAYLKDLDYLETRLRSGKPVKTDEVNPKKTQPKHLGLVDGGAKTRNHKESQATAPQPFE